MLGVLTPGEIEELLANRVLGRIGCHDSGRTYVVPVSYAYDGKRVLVHGADGLKNQVMRANPEVCFEVELIEDLSNWRTVIAQGTYRELTGEQAAMGMLGLMTRLVPFVVSSTTQAQTVDYDGLVKKPVLFEIILREKTGWFESSRPRR